jgi:hypothetical protein
MSESIVSLGLAGRITWVVRSSHYSGSFGFSSSFIECNKAKNARTREFELVTISPKILDNSVLDAYICGRNNLKTTRK